MHFTCHNCMREGSGWEFSGNSLRVTDIVCPQCGSQESVYETENYKKPCSACDHDGSAPELCRECRVISKDQFKIDKPHFKGIVEKKKPEPKYPEKEIIKKSKPIQKEKPKPAKKEKPKGHVQQSMFSGNDARHGQS